MTREPSFCRQVPVLDAHIRRQGLISDLAVPDDESVGAEGNGAASTPSYVGQFTIDQFKQLFFGFLNGMAEFVAFVQIVTNVSLSLLQKLPLGIWTSIGAMILVLPLLWYAVFRELSFTKGVYK